MSRSNQKIKELLDKYVEPLLSDEQIQALHQVSEELNSDSAIRSLEIDPYWPKWDSPWWKIILLYDTGFKHLIPNVLLRKLIEIIDKHYLHHFPIVESEIPIGCDPYRHILCFCALGNIYRILEGCGFNVQNALPWCYDWFCRYQLPDGGYNCDESAYTGSRKSSFQSTLPMLEAMLLVYKKTGDDNIKVLLDKGAQYLIKHGIYKSTDGKIIDEEWLKPTFPGYYNYDILRGFLFLTDWQQTTHSTVPDTIVSDCIDTITNSLNEDGCIIQGKNVFFSEGSLYHIDNSWIWKDGSELFQALELFSREGDVSAPLNAKWHKTLMCLVEY